MANNKRSQSLGLSLMGATTTVAFWLLWRTRHNGKVAPSMDSVEPCKEGRYNSSDDRRNNETNNNDDDQLDSSQSSMFNEEEVEQVWTDSGEVDLKLFKQLILRKQEKCQRPTPKSGSKLTLFSHLVSRLEQTVGENQRIRAKLGQIKSSNNTNDGNNVTKSDAELPLTTSATAAKNNDTSSKNNASVFMVVQRFRGATLLINENHIVRVGSFDEDEDYKKHVPKNQFCGMLVYVSFAKGATQSMVKAAAKIIVNLPILTLGGWGDGVSKNMSVLDLASQQLDTASLMIVPQANLICKVRSQGKSIQYHGQVDKSEGGEMYQYFVNCIRGLILEYQCQVREASFPDWYQKCQSAQSGSSPQHVSPSTPPEELFRDASLYNSWDDNGIPLTDAENEPITKSAQKKLRKAQAAHKVKHLKYLREQSRSGQSQTPSSTAVLDQRPASRDSIVAKPDKERNWATAVDPSFVNIVAGTFGKRQSLEFVADMGPFCHVIQV